DRRQRLREGRVRADRYERIEPRSGGRARGALERAPASVEHEAIGVGRTQRRHYADISELLRLLRRGDQSPDRQVGNVTRHHHEPPPPPPLPPGAAGAKLTPISTVDDPVMILSMGMTAGAMGPMLSSNSSPSPARNAPSLAPQRVENPRFGSKRNPAKAFASAVSSEPFALPPRLMPQSVKGILSCL